MEKASKLPFSWSRVLTPMVIGVSIGSFILDQLTKYIIVVTMPLGSSISVLPFLELVHIKNRGAAFGFLHDSSLLFRVIFFGIVTVICLVFLLQWLGTTDLKEKWARLSMALILGGALGNLLDRVAFQQVTDFVHVFYKSFSWPAFNVADSAISVGVTIIVGQLLFSKLLPR